MHWKNFCSYNLTHHRKKTQQEISDRQTEKPIFSHELLFSCPPIHRGRGVGGKRVAHLPLFSLFHHGGPPSLNHDHVRLLLHHRLCIPRMWLTVPRMWLTITPGRRAVAPRGRGRALLAVRGWVGWLKNKIMIWLDIYLQLGLGTSFVTWVPIKLICVPFYFSFCERNIRIFSAGMGFLNL